MEIFTLHVPAKKGKFDLFKALESDFQNGDIVVVSSKFVAMSEGSVAKLDLVVPSAEAKRLAKKYRMDERLAQLVIDESDEIVGGISGFALAMRKGMIAPNAGSSHTPSYLASTS